jgi:signal transduction histidine kinase/ligand-binding sensor domain-containing protein/CheY-like chemotaxis protein
VFHVLFISASSPPKFYHLSHEQGLSQSTVNSIIKDSEGFFWFCTNDGLNRWDGYAFTHYFHNEDDEHSIGLGRVNALIEDKDNVLWFATNQGGLSRFNRDFNSFDNFPISDSTEIVSEYNNITSIISFGDFLLLGTFDKGICLFDKRKEEYRQVSLQHGETKSLQGLIDIQLFIDKTNNIWVAHSQGVFLVHYSLLLKDNLLVVDREYLNGQSVLEVYNDKEGHIWFGTYESGAYRLNVSTNKLFHLPYGRADSKHLNHPIVRTFNEDPEGNLWIGTGGGGVNIYNPQTGQIKYVIQKLADKYAISSNIVYYIYNDSEHNLWIGTYNGGVSYTSWYRQSFNHVRSFGSQGDLNNNAILSFCEVPDGKIWIGTDGGGINVYNPLTGKHSPLHIEGYALPQVVTALKTDTKGKVYIGTYRDGFLIYDYSTGVLKQFLESDKNSIESNDIWDIALDSTEETIWLATLGGGLNKYIASENKFYHYKHDTEDKTSITEDYLSTVFLDDEDNVWVGTYHGGICLLKKNSESGFVRFKHDSISNLKSNEIKVIYQDSKGRMLFGTQDGGLNVLHPGSESFSVFQTQDGLPSNTVQGILQDDTGVLWLSTNNGLARVQFVGDDTLVSRNYTKLDGLQANEFNIHSTFKDKHGKLYFGGINGYNSFYPLNIFDYQKVGEMILTNMYIFDKKVEVGDANSHIEKSLTYAKKVRLKHRQTTFTFEYAMLDYSVPELNTYEYRLVGFDENWVSVGNRRRATYTNIDPGTYTFEVRGVNSQGLPSKSTASLEIILAPPFYKTPLSRLFTIGVILLLLMVIYRFRVQTLRLQGETLQSMVDERTAELRSLNTVLENRNAEINKQSEELRSKQQSLLEANQMLEKSFNKIENQNIELSKHRYNLEEIVKERTIELEKAKKMAEESEQLKMAFLSNMSHEIRTPMNAIVGFASLLADEKLDQNEKTEYIRQVNMNSESLLILIDDILDLSKIEANQLTVKKATFEVNSFLNEIFFNWQLLKQKGNSPVEFEYSNSLKDKEVYIYSDEVRLRQILNNLLDNAFKFTSKGVIEVLLNKEGNDIIFSVRDTGIGINTEDVGHIFNRFRKGEDSGKKLYRGAGLGLTISNKLAKMLNARLWVNSRKGEGSQFYISVPCGKISTHEISEKPQLLPDEGKNDLSLLKVLVVEDEETNFNYLNGVLKKRKIEVDWARNGEEAVKLVSVNSYHLILMDIKMPVMDGVEATKKIKSMFPKQIIIAQTAFARPEEESEFRKVGFDDYLAKPIKSKKLLHIIEQYISS